MSEQWMSIVEYARKFAISDMTVRRRIRNGKLHAVLRDGKYYIPIQAQQSVHGMEFPDPEPKAYATGKPPLPVIPRNHNMSADRGFSERSAAYELNERSLSPKFSSENTIRPNANDSRPPSYDTSALIRSFESTLAKFSSLENSLKGSYEAKIQALEDRLKSKDVEIARLQQQLEDLQTLINMIDQPLKP